MKQEVQLFNPFFDFSMFLWLLFPEVQAELAAADESRDPHPPHAGQVSTSKSEALLKKGISYRIAAKSNHIVGFDFY